MPGRAKRNRAKALRPAGGAGDRIEILSRCRGTWARGGSGAAAGKMADDRRRARFAASGRTEYRAGPRARRTADSEGRGIDDVWRRESGESRRTALAHRRTRDRRTRCGSVRAFGTFQNVGNFRDGASRLAALYSGRSEERRVG